MKKEEVLDNSNVAGNSIEYYRRNAKKIKRLILILAVMVCVFVLIDTFFNVSSSFMDSLVFVSFLLFCIILYRKIIWKIIKWSTGLIFEGRSEK